MTEPLQVTAIIPAYNRPAMTARAVRSALGQRPQRPAEVLVVNDCSTDDTGDAARAAGATVIRHDANRGEGGARNTAIRAATHEWVALLDSDDEWLPGHLAALWPHRADHVIMGTSGIACTPDPAHDALVGRPRATPQVLNSPADLLHGGNALVATSVMVRRDTAIRAGLFVEGMRRAADLDLWLRVLELGTGYVSPAVTVRYHQHEDQVSGDDALMWDAHQAVVESYADRAWYSRTAVAGSEARLIWDRLRADLRQGECDAALAGACRIARDPQLARGLWELLSHRFLLRRRGGRYTRSGTPTVRVWATSPDVLQPRRAPAGSCPMPRHDRAGSARAWGTRCASRRASRSRTRPCAPPPPGSEARRSCARTAAAPTRSSRWRPVAKPPSRTRRGAAS